MVIYVDDDDDHYDFKLPRLRYVRGPRITLSKMWNKCQEMALGPIYGHMGDDIIFRTEGWDTMVKEAFKQYDDRIAFVHGDDMSGVHGPNFGTHGFIHKNWVDTVGYFVPPYYVSDFNDTHLNDVANMLGRRVYLDGLKTEHMHFVFGKGEKDQTHEERLARHVNEKVDELYHSDKMAKERLDHAEKLQEFIDKHRIKNAR